VSSSKRIQLGRIKVKYYSDSERLLQVERYEQLSEKQQRHFLGFEYKRLGKGSQRYLSRVFGCSRHRIRKGFIEIESSVSLSDAHGQRHQGGGRKKRD
jgi:hypothetical protein